MRTMKHLDFLTGEGNSTNMYNYEGLKRCLNFNTAEDKGCKYDFILKCLLYSI